jgi:hypothetical protein
LRVDNAEAVVDASRRLSEGWGILSVAARKNNVALPPPNVAGRGARQQQ